MRSQFPLTVSAIWQDDSSVTVRLRPFKGGRGACGAMIPTATAAMRYGFKSGFAGTAFLRLQCSTMLSHSQPRIPHARTHARTHAEARTRTRAGTPPAPHPHKHTKAPHIRPPACPPSCAVDVAPNPGNASFDVSWALTSVAADPAASTVYMSDFLAGRIAAYLLTASGFQHLWNLTQVRHAQP
jgi:hypothetical protein